MIKNIVLFFFLLTLLTLNGCINANEPKIPPEQNREVAAPDTEEGAMSKSVREVLEFTSPDKKYTVYLGGSGALYVGEGTDITKADVIEIGRTSYDYISWSPDSKYFFAGNKYAGVIIRLGEKHTMFNIEGLVAGPFWSPEGDRVGFTITSQVYKEGQSGESTDILVKKLDNDMLGGIRFVRGDFDTYFKMDGWDNSDKVIYSKYTKDGDKLIEQYTSEFGHHLYTIDISTQEKKIVDVIKDLEYLYFNPSPDFHWLSMVKLTFSGGEAECGIPFFYNMSTRKRFGLNEEYSSWDWNAKWFSDSQRIMLNERKVFDVSNKKITTFDYPEDLILLGGEPSPDGSKIAVLTCKRIQKTGSQGEPVTIHLWNAAGKKIKTIATPCIPYFSGNLQSPVPMRFTWTKDQQSLILESWQQKDYKQSSLYQVNLADDSVRKFLDAGETPVVSPDGQRLVTLVTVYEEKRSNPNILIRVHSLDGTLLHELDLQKMGHYGYTGQVLWNDTSESIVFTTDKLEDGVVGRYLVVWDLKNGSVKEINTEQAVRILSFNGNEIICIDGSVYQ